nr:MAG TPA: Lower baseplate protein N-terminal domain [Caudoviricetes sp.]
MAKKTYPSGVITPELGSTNWYSDYDTNSLLLDSNITKTNSLDSKVKELETSYKNVETSLTSLSAVAKSGDYNDLSNKPESIALAEKAVADGDNNVITKTYATKKEVVTSLEPYVKKTELADVATSGSYTDLSDKPTTIAHADRSTADKNGDVITVTYAKKTEIPNLDGYALSKDISKVGKTNNYKDLDNLPTIPSLDGYVTDVELSPVAKSGDYNDLSNTPKPVDLTPYATKEELGSKADDANVVHKSGTETIVGTKTFSGEVQTNTIKAVGGGANISLTPPDNGAFAIRAYNGTVNKELVGYPNGMLAWDNNEILTKVNGVTLDTAQTITGAKTFVPWQTFSNGLNVKWITGNKEKKPYFCMQP